MGYHYQQLTIDDRNQIYALRKAGFTVSLIAQQLDRDNSTIYRELNRNTGGRGYRPKQAQAFSALRKSEKSKPLKMRPGLIAYIEEKIEADYSPEQISDALKNEDKHQNMSISPETIYQHIYADQRSGGTLHKHLRGGKKKRRRRRKHRDLRGKIRNRVDIELRPAIVALRTRLGDWEADLVCGASHSGYLVTLVDRTSRVILIGFSKTKQADSVTLEILRLLKNQTVKTITFDNGKEFAGHELIAKTLDCACYFAKPYRSWERGTNENTNGLLRQYFPKKMLFNRITSEQIAFAQNRLNTRPRKCLVFRPPNVIHYGLAA